MSKIKYKQPSANFDRITNKDSKNTLRASLGREQGVGEFFYISRCNLIAYEKQARKNFDELEILQLAKTIKENGISSPLQVIPSEKNPGKFEVVSGERRLRASEMVNLEKLPCIILKDESKAEEIALIENIQRSDLHPIELGNALASLTSFYKWGNITRLAEKIGKAQSTVSLHLAYANLPEKIKDFLIKNNIRSRDFLRKVLKIKNLDEMEKFIGFSGNKIEKKTLSILRINKSENQFFVQSKAIDTLNDEEKIQLLTELEKLVCSLKSKHVSK